jgi:hypothetical protein
LVAGGLGFWEHRNIGTQASTQGGGGEAGVLGRQLHIHGQTRASKWWRAGFS